MRYWIIAVLLFAPIAAQAQTVTNLTLNPTITAGGNNSTGTVTISAPAPSGGTAVSLSSSNTGAATVPASVTVAQGFTTANFTVTTIPGSTTRTSTITASLNGSSRTKDITVVPPDFSDFTLSAYTIKGGLNVTGTVTLTGTAVGSGMTYNLTSTNSLLVSMPASVTVPAGQSSANFTIVTSTVNGSSTLTIFALDANQTGGYRDLTLTDSYTQLRVTDYWMPHTARLVWEGVGGGGWILKRNGVTIANLGAYVNTYDDTFGGAAPPAGEIVYELYYTQAPTILQGRLRTSLGTIQATENQAVDSRLDLRYSTTKYVDFLFGERIYRGGLFVGKASDGSRVGRSFAKFNVGGMPSPFLFHTANVNAYSTGNFTTGMGTVNVSVGCQVIPTDTWTWQAMKWTNQPAVTPADANEFKTITFNPQSPSHAWYRWPLASDIATVMNGDQVATVAWTAQDETADGWAYLAKKEYDTALGPRVTTVNSFPKYLTVSSSAAQINPGQQVTLTITLDGLGPGQSVTITETCNGRHGIHQAQHGPVSHTIDSLHRTLTISPSQPLDVMLPFTWTATFTYHHTDPAKSVTGSVSILIQ